MEITKFDYSRFELEYKLLPKYYYEEKNLKEMITQLMDGIFMPAVFEEICKEDNIECPFDEDPFSVSCFGFLTIKCIQVNMPMSRNNKIRSALRLYFLYVPEENGEIGFRKYFLTETSSKGEKIDTH